MVQIERVVDRHEGVVDGHVTDPGEGGHQLHSLRTSAVDRRVGAHRRDTADRTQRIYDREPRTHFDLCHRHSFLSTGLFSANAFFLSFFIVLYLLFFCSVFHPRIIP